MVRRHLMQNIFTMEAVQECKRRHREAKRLPWDGAMISECHLGKVAAGSPAPAPLVGALRPAALCAGAMEPGEPVAVVGHALLHPRARLDAGVTAGVLARVVCNATPAATSAAAAAGRGAVGAGGARAEPAMLLTTAPVYPGAALACAWRLHAPSSCAWLPKSLHACAHA